MLFSTFTSCTKFGKNVTVTGRVVNPLTGQGFEGLEVQLQKTKNSLPGGYTSVKEVYTDSEGYFEINHLAGANSYHVMVQTTADQYRLGWLIDGNYQQNSQLGITKGKKMNVDYHAVPYGKLILNIENVNCEGLTDTMVFRAKGQFDEDYTNWSALERIGCYSYTSPPPYTNFPMGYRYYEMKVTRPSGITFVYDTVFIPETGVAQIDLFY